MRPSSPLAYRPGVRVAFRHPNERRVNEFAQPLRERDLDPDPVRQFARWFDDAGRAGVRAPEAAAVATATADGAPSVRMVLVKGFGPRGFEFFTNYGSRKARELAENPRAALMFHWDVLGRAVRIEGPVERLSAVESTAYTRSRPRGSQLSALASPQSDVVESREWLERRVSELDERHGGGELPLHDSWGGYRIVPERFEFWQHREDRLHDRLVYAAPDGGGWRVVRLAP
jgi:pyridoxamine 5'-phosphate oxidase